MYEFSVSALVLHTLPTAIIRTSEYSSIKPLSHIHQTRVEPGLTHSHVPLNSGSTGVSKVGSTLLTVGLNPGYEV